MKLSRIGRALVYTLLIASTGCATLDSSYNKLNLVEKRRVLKYDPMTKHNFDKLFLHEITAKAIKEDMRKDWYYVILNWDPKAKSTRHNLSYYSKLNDKMSVLHVKTYLVMPRYELKAAEQQYKKYGYADKIYVPDREVYGKYKTGDSKPFMEDLVDDKISNKDSLKNAGYVIYQNNQILAYGMNTDEIVNILAIDVPVEREFHE
jgi:hypothetical protein